MFFLTQLKEYVVQLDSPFRKRPLVCAQPQRTEHVSHPRDLGDIRVVQAAEELQ